MKLRYDNSADALDIRLLDDALIVRTEEIDSGTLIDLDEQGRLVAIEIIVPARRWPLDDVLARFEIEEADATVLRSLWREHASFPFAAQRERVPA